MTLEISSGIIFSLTEVKNVKYISNTQQLRDFADFRMLIYAIVLIAAMIIKETNAGKNFASKFIKKSKKEVNQ